MVRNRFDQQLENLNTELVTMGAICEDAITFATKALFDKDMEMAKKAKEAERQIDQMEKEADALRNNPDSLEAFARETYHFAAPGDDVYIVD